MRNIVTIHQPNYLPWVGLFSKVKKADCFIIADTFPYTKNSVVNRNKIRTSTGWSYLTIPINREFYQSRICDVTLPLNKSWREDHWKTIQLNYAKAHFFSTYRDFFEELYRKDFQYLWEVNVEIILYLLKCFEIDVEVIKSSDLDVDKGLHQTEALVALLKAVDAATYLSGPSGKNYLDFKQFRSNNIDLEFFSFEHPVYQQRFNDFIPNMSAIDLLFNTGPDANRAVASSGTIENK